jgi:CHAD domain-containing protein
MLCTILGSVMSDLLPYASCVASGSHDAEHIHQLRVGLRRLRTALREFSSSAKDVDPAWDTNLRRVFTELGQVRDDDVVAEAVRPVLLEAGALKLDWHKSAHADDATEAVRNQTFQLTLLDLLKYSLSDADSRRAPARSHRACRRHLEKRLAHLHRQAVLSGKRFAKLPLNKQHQVRKRLKRLRYLAEFVAPLGSALAVEKYLDALRSAQDALGMHNDIGVAAGHFRADGKAGSESHRSADILDQHARRTGKSAQVVLRRLSKVSPFWNL